MARGTKRSTQGRTIKRAAVLVTEALDLLDAHGDLPEAAAHLAMAQQKLLESIGKLR